MSSTLEQHIYWLLSQRLKQILTQILDKTEFSFFRFRFCLEDVYFAQNSKDVAMICFDVRAFDLSKASSMLPTYSEKDLEMYLSNFEKTADASAWPKDKRAVIQQPKLSDKALKAYYKLSVNDLSDYKIGKEAVLDELELVAEVYIEYDLETALNDRLRSTVTLLIL